MLMNQLVRPVLPSPPMLISADWARYLLRTRAAPAPGADGDRLLRLVHAQGAAAASRGLVFSLVDRSASVALVLSK